MDFLVRPQCVIFEDSSLLVVCKPAGWSTHKPSPYAGDGIYEWLRCREPEWAHLAIIHRLDKATSGVLVFTKGALANKSLTGQFTQRLVKKSYNLLTDRPIPKRKLRIRSQLVRVGDRYVCRPEAAGGDSAETLFKPLGEVVVNALDFKLPSPLYEVEAVPLTGRTHQIRAHAAEAGFPILGDDLYGGTPARRVFLHASEIRFIHPVSGKEVAFTADPDFACDPSDRLRTALMPIFETDAFRHFHGEADGRPGFYVDQFGPWLLAQSEQPLGADEIAILERLMSQSYARGAAHKLLLRRVQETTMKQAGPRVLVGDAPKAPFVARENGVSFEISFEEGYSVGLFLDQRDNRRRLIKRHVAPGFSLDFPDLNSPPRLLNAFSYTCGFSVCAAASGFHTTSLDLSKKYLEWGKRNFALNDLDSSAHDFVFGDAFDWLSRWAKRGKSFELVILDPPTFSRSKKSGSFRADKDYGALAQSALKVLVPGGVLLASCNTETWAPEEFVATLGKAVADQGRRVLLSHYSPQPPDFPVSRGDPAYLKTLWLKIS